MAVANEKLVAARLQKRWSMAVASEKVGVSVNTFNRWERGLQIPQLGTLDQVCKAFELTPEELGFEQAIRIRKSQANKSETPMPTTQTSPPFQVAEKSTILLGSLQRQIQELQSCVEQVRRSLDTMNLAQNKRDGGEGVSRRQAIAALIGTPAAVLGIAQESVHTRLLHTDEVLSLCTSNIPLAWQLYFEGGLVEVEQILQHYLAPLGELAQQPSIHQQHAARLASQAYQLSSLVALQHQNFGIAHIHAQRALSYGEIVNDPNLKTTSLIRQAQVYFYLKQPLNRLRTYEQALSSIAGSSPLLQGRVYIGLTETHGHLNNTYDTAHYLELAQSVFPTHFTEDPNYTYTHFNHWSFSALEGLTYLHLKQPEMAWDNFAQIDKLVPQTPVPNRVELTVRQARAAYALGDRDLTCNRIEASVQFALAAGNQLRYNETYAIFEDMQRTWHNDHKVQALGDLFH